MNRPIRLLLGLALVFTSSLFAEYPATEIVPVEDLFHGEKIADPYRWLEGSDAPEIVEPAIELDARVVQWTERQNRYTRSVLDALPGRGRFEKRLDQLLAAGTTSIPSIRGDRLFFLRRNGGQAQNVLYVQDGQDRPRVLLDPTELDDENLTAISWFVPSQDGKLLAFGLQRAGDENTTLQVLRVDEGQWLADEIPNKVEDVFWKPDGSGFFYRRLREASNPYSAQIRFHRLGTHDRHDRLIFEQYKEGPLATTWGPHALVDPQARWMLMTYFTGTDANDLWLYDLKAWEKTGDLKRTDLIIGERAETIGLIADETLFLKTNFEAPNGQIFAVDLTQPEREHWRLVIPERSEAVIEYVGLSKNYLVVLYLDKAVNRIERFDFAGKSLGALELPGLGSAGFSTYTSSDTAYVAYESFDAPDSLYRIDLSTGELKLWWRKEVDFDSDAFVVEQVFYPSKDGTKVSMFIARPKDLKLDGSHPTLLSGYGGFNVARTPSFSNFVSTWIESGGIFVLANLRGGGEYGKAWHRAGMLESKQNVFDDFIAAADWLIANRYTSPPHLGIRGGSNGGLLTGAALVQRPELFSAVVSAVPLLDMLRYQHFLMARFWVPEYGSAEDPSQFEYLRRYSPYQNVEPGKAYPATLLTAGENDTRVHALHARKMAARLQAASASDPLKEPILLWVERNVGHGPGKPLALRLRDLADQLSFMAWQLGLDVETTSGP